MFFKEIRKTEHYIENHEQHVPWSKVVEIILTTKEKRKKDGKIEIDTEKFYVLCEIKDNVLYVINAKNK